MKGRCLCGILLALSAISAVASSIDRHALVSRHNVVLTAFNGERPLQVGNGEFAFGMDITGLQTFAPFNTMSQWGWHTGALPAGVKEEDYQGVVLETHGRPVRYPLFDPAKPKLSSWLAANPHRINLGRVGLVLTKLDGHLGRQLDIKNPNQSLDLWTGIVTSRFEFEGEPVVVTTACDPKSDSIGVEIKSRLVRTGQIAAFLQVPGNNPLQFANFVGDWDHPVRLEPTRPSPQTAEFLRSIDHDSYRIRLAWEDRADLQASSNTDRPALRIVKAEYGTDGKWLNVTEAATRAIHDGQLTMRATNELGDDPAPKLVKRLRVVYLLDGQEQSATVGENEVLHIGSGSMQNRVILKPNGMSDTLKFTCGFAPKAVKSSTAPGIFAACRRHWPAFWKSGGAIDLSGSRDPRWHELERRIVLSQYLMAVNEAGSLPPQESGLVNNGWFGRFHLEMTWWHAAHYALWNRWPQLNPSIGLYNRLLPSALARAKGQGYLGARWPKCIGPNAVEWPHEIHSFLIWQQPHPIFFAELNYRAHPTAATLKKWDAVVQSTADFLASYAFRDPATGRYVLGPPLHLVSENTDPMNTQNPTFELAYWRFGLRTAQAWRQRQRLPKRPEWDLVLSHLSPLPVENGLYISQERTKNMWTEFNFEHPGLTGAYGVLPGDGVEPATMRRTLDQVMAKWNFSRTWGWDFPMMAMCAARLNEPDRAVDFLMTKEAGFQFDECGLATGGPFPYFPSNGGLLYAVAMMAAGWDGAPHRHAPGFPDNGRWVVRAEGLNAAP